ncbi:MAG: isoprenyl transferase [Gammaproteobacteria bacterium]
MRTEIATSLDAMPRHIAIIMDGNGRWAKRRLLPRFAGHRQGVKAVKRTVEACKDRGVEVLTLFAFSSENWRRPKQEVGLLMDLFLRTLKKEISRLSANGVRIRFIGDRSAFDARLQALMSEAEKHTAENTDLTLVIAANYGGRWDVMQAIRQLATQMQMGAISAEDIDETLISKMVCVADLPEPDLFIRTGGEKRISNFLLWQLAYTELYFTDLLWPDFNEDSLDEALLSFLGRQRRFGQTGEQVEKSSHA